MTSGAALPDARPVRGAERLVALDFTRGVAVLGILLANITGYAHPRLAYSWPGALPGGGDVADGWIWLAQLVLVDGKLRGLFTLLFGAGLALFVERARAAGGSGGLQLRRLLLLGLFGLAHFYLLFTGDILFLYAVAGLAALAFVDMEPRGQLWLGIAWYLALTSLDALFLFTPATLELGQSWQPDAAEYRVLVEGAWQARIAHAAQESAVMAGGSFADIVRFRLESESRLLGAYAYLAFVDTLPVMLIGMALYRMGLFDGAPERSRNLRRWGWTGVVLGGVLTGALGLWVLLRGFPPQLTGFVFNGATAPLRLPTMLGFAALLAAWAPSAAATGLGARIVAAGRMAFSNYIGTSLLMAVIFQGWALGLYGQLHRAGLLPFVLLGWALMLGWSQPWLTRFRYGPLEWLWRCGTYGRLFPLRR